MTVSPDSLKPDLPIGIIDILPNPILVKDSDCRYVWINNAFEELFGVDRADIIGRVDAEVFKDRQVAQCNGGDIRVLVSGEIDEAYETVYRSNSEPRETITRKRRLILDDGTTFLVGVMHDITDITEANRKLEEQSEELRRMVYTDALTGCYNRRALFDEAEDRFSDAKNKGSLLLLDIDFFKKINDTHGHDAGDAALVHFAKVVQNVIRKDDMLARFGGEEFAVLLPGADADESRRIAGRICSQLESTPLKTNDGEIKMTVSIGAIHKLGEEPMDLSDWLRSADKCLYDAKQLGRNRVVFA